MYNDEQQIEVDQIRDVNFDDAEIPQRRQQVA